VTHDRQAFELLVGTRQLDLAYRRLPLLVALSLTVPLVFIALMRSIFPEKELAAILAMMWTATAVRWMLWRAWSRSSVGPRSLRTWTIRYWLVTTFAAVAWSASALLLVVDASPQATLMLAIMMFAVTAIGSNSLASHLPSAITFIVVILAPLAGVMVIESDHVVRVSGLAMVVGMLALIATVVRGGTETASLLRTELRLSDAVAEAMDARGVAERASVAKSEFLANMSHELRTPLNAILGYSEMLGEDARAGGSTDTAADLDKITSAGRHLLALINDVLDLSKIEAGRMELHLDTVDVAAVVRGVVDTSGTLAAAAGNVLSVEGLDQLGTIQSDARKLQQVLLNLVGNACKFTSNGQVRLTCARLRGDDGDRLMVAVRDTGIGIAPEQMDRLFTQFMQADNSATRQYGGTGLGLAISQRLCRLMGGTITVESRFGKGSTFTLHLPVVAPGADDRAGLTMPPARCA
jgi:signal transduction histidine kinase